MRPIDIVGHAGHRVHIARNREANLLFRWLGDLSGRRVLDVGGGDGYWAAQAQRRGAHAVSVDLDERRTERGRRFTHRPALVRGDALKLPFADSSFDAILSVSSIEHFASVDTAIAEMGRVLKPDGGLVLTADSLASSTRWPELAAAHRKRYSVVHPLDHQELERHLVAHGLKPVEAVYLFKRPWSNRLYFELSRHRLLWNVAAPLSPLVARSDRREQAQRGSIVAIRAIATPSRPLR